MRKRQLAILFPLLFGLLFTGCGSQSSGTAASGNNTSGNPEAGWNESADASTTPMEQTLDAPAPDESMPDALANAKLIYTGDMSLQTQDFETAVKDIETITQSLGGYLQSSSSSGEIGYRYASYTVRIPSENFDTFRQQIGESCHVIDQHASLDNVTEAYVDIEARLATLNTKHERLLALLEQADTMENIIALETALADTEYEIEQYTGSLRHYDSLIAFSTINITLDEVPALDPVNKEVGFGTQLKNAFLSGGNWLILFVRGLILFFALIWPLWTFLLVVVLIIFLVIRPRMQRKRAQNTWSVPSAKIASPPSKTDDDNPSSSS